MNNGVSSIVRFVRVESHLNIRIVPQRTEALEAGAPRVVGRREHKMDTSTMRQTRQALRLRCFEGKKNIRHPIQHGAATSQISRLTFQPQNLSQRALPMLPRPNLPPEAEPRPEPPSRLKFSSATQNFQKPSRS